MVLSSIQLLQRRLNYQFSEPKLLEQALTHRSKARSNNERFEFLGDSLLGAYISERLFFKFPDQDEGVLTRLRSQLVKKSTLADIASDYELNQHIILGPAELRSGGSRHSSIIADAVEAIIAAVYLDGGIKPMQNLLAAIYDERLNKIDPDVNFKDAKSRLQEYLQQHEFDLPDYELVHVQGPDHARKFTISCKIQSSDHAFMGEARSRRQAEQNAASKAFEYLIKKR